MLSLRFKHWAQPVTSRPWALLAVALSFVHRHTPIRMSRYSHGAWRKATAT